MKLLQLVNQIVQRLIHNNYKNREHDQEIIQMLSKKISKENIINPFP